MNHPWNYKIIFPSGSGLAAGVLFQGLRAFERFGFVPWVSQELAPNYAISATDAREVLVVSTFVGFEYQTVLSDDLEDVERILMRFGGSLELRAGYDTVELGLDPANATLSIGVTGAYLPETQNDVQAVFLRLCNKLAPLAGCGYNLETLSLFAELQDDFPRAVAQGRPPQQLYSLNYLNTDYLQSIGLERISSVAQRLDYGPNGVFVWLDRGPETVQIAELQSDGRYQKRLLQTSV